MRGGVEVILNPPASGGYFRPSQWPVGRRIWGTSQVFVANPPTSGGCYHPGETITGRVVFTKKTFVTSDVTVTLSGTSFTYYTTGSGNASSTVPELINLFIPRVQQLVSTPCAIEAGTSFPFTLRLPTTTEFNRPFYRPSWAQITPAHSLPATGYANGPHELPPSFGRTGIYTQDGIGYAITAQYKTKHALRRRHIDVYLPVTTSPTMTASAIGVSPLNQVTTVAMSGGTLLMHIYLPVNAWEPLRLSLSSSANPAVSRAEMRLAQIEFRVRQWKFQRVLSQPFRPGNSVLNKAHVLKLDNLTVPHDEPILVADKQSFAMFALGKEGMSKVAILESLTLHCFPAEFYPSIRSYTFSINYVLEVTVKMRMAGSIRLHECFAAVPWIVQSVKRPPAIATNPGLRSRTFAEIDKEQTDDGTTVTEDGSSGTTDHMSTADGDTTDALGMDEAHSVLTSNATATLPAPKHDMHVSAPAAARGQWQQKRAHGFFTSLQGPKLRMQQSRAVVVDPAFNTSTSDRYRTMSYARSI